MKRIPSRIGTRLRSTDSLVRFDAIVAIGKNPADVTGAVVDGLIDLACRSQDRRELAILAHVLGRINDKRAAPVLEQLLLNNLDSKVGKLAAKSLGYLGRKQSLPVLFSARNAPSHIVRSAVKAAIERIETAP